MRYPYYDIVKNINTLKDLVWEHDMGEKRGQTSFSFRKGKDVVRKTYHEFAWEVKLLGEYLLRNHDKRHIGIYGENSYEYLLFYFAAVTVGKVAIPVDVGLSEKDALDLVNRSDCDIVVYSELYQDVAKWWQENGLKKPLLKMAAVSQYMEIGRKSAAEDARKNEAKYRYDEIIVSDKDIATIVYTSGTTGRSKGVVLTHKNVCSDIVNTCRSFCIYGGVVAVLPFHHIFGMVASIMMIYHFGYPIHINNSPKYIMRDIEEFKPQTMLLVPLYIETFYKQIFDSVKKQGKEKSIMFAMKAASFFLRFGIDLRKYLFREIIDKFGGKLNCMICGGAALDPYYVTAFRKLGFEVYNGYGITECASVISVNRNETNVVGSVGQVIPHCNVRIAEDGEILAKGDNVFGGYYHDEENTKRSFSDGWYHTGDLGYLKNDSLYITGRKKNLIILSNGENISPEGIERELLRMDSICEVIVRGEGSHLSAEVFPEKGILDEDYKTIIEGEIAAWNRKQPMCRRIADIKYRGTEFEKTTSRKIKRQ